MNIIVQETALGNGRLKVMIKDCIDIQGYKTLSGSRAYLESAQATRNAAVVDAILMADCKIIAKTNMHELAFGITGINQYFGTPANSRYPGLIPGGSSSGSAAAVAAGLADFSIGTDTGGSIRMPAACCGVIGLKPTYGRVSRQGVHPPQSSLDCVGPLACDMDCIETAMQALDPSFQKRPALKNLPKLAYLNVDASDEVWSCVKEYFLQRQLELDDVNTPSFNQAYDAGMHIINYENWQSYAALCETGKLGADVEQRLIRASATVLTDVEKALKVKAQFQQELSQIFETYDFLVLPTLPNIPPLISEAENTVAFLDLTRLVRPFNVSGHPAISLPLETAQGAPVGLQLVAKPNADEDLCALAAYLMDLNVLQKKEN